MKENNNKKFWNRTASIYDASRRPEKDAYNKMIDLIRSLLTPDMNVPELATATSIIAGMCKAVRFSKQLFHLRL